MKCPHFHKGNKGNFGLSCSAADNFYLPSLFQIREYCRRSGYRKCPFFLAHISPAGSQKTSALSGGKTGSARQLRVNSSRQ